MAGATATAHQGRKKEEEKKKKKRGGNQRVQLFPTSVPLVRGRGRPSLTALLAVCLYEVLQATRRKSGETGAALTPTIQLLVLVLCQLVSLVFT